jgi:ABC-type phosphate/phosphonate transport system ATPase subunit
LTPVHWIEQCFPGHDQHYYRSQLGKYGISGELALKRIEHLSGGQKSRLVFARIGMVGFVFVLFSQKNRFSRQKRIFSQRKMTFH